MLHACLSWLADEGFDEMAREAGVDYASAHHYRQRHQLEALRAAAAAPGAGRRG